MAVEIHPISSTGHVLMGQALSGDGAFVVGTQGTAPTSSPFRWSVAGGYEALPAPGDSAHGWVEQVNADGSAFIGNFLGGTPGYRWTAPGSYTEPITVPERRAAAALGINGDGTVVVGDSRGGGSSAYTFRYGPGGYTEFDDVDGDGTAQYKEFNGVSADGRYAVGQGLFDYVNNRVFRHDFNTGGRTFLGGSSDFWSATAISADAGVVIGKTSNIAISPYRWDVATGNLTMLGSLDPTRQAIANDLNGNGSVIVGRSITANGSMAFVWDAAGGMRSLASYVGEKGGDASGWSFQQAVGISDDGDAILAQGSRNDFDNGPVLITGLNQPGAPARVGIGLSPDGLSIEISVETVLGQDYWLEGRASLASGDWNPETTPSAGTGALRTFAVSRSSYPASGYFFRVATSFSPGT